MSIQLLVGLVLLLQGSLGADELLQTAETVLAYQRSSGGWPKNYDREERLTESRFQDLQAARDQRDSTIDNGATPVSYTHLTLPTILRV